MVDCVFKNFKECFVQAKDITRPAEYNYLMCVWRVYYLE